MISLRCHPLFRHIPGCLRKLSVTSSLENPIMVKMPALSPTMSDGGIVSWLKEEGEEVTAGDGLCEIQTDKAVVTMEIEEDGTLAKILKPENTMGIRVGDLIAVIAEDGEDWRSVPIPTTDSAPVDVVQDRVNDSLAPARSSPDVEYPPLRDVTGSGIGPAVRLLLELYRLRPLDIPASGPHGRLLKGDILAHIAQHQLRPQPPSDSPPPKVSSVSPDRVVKAPPPAAAATRVPTSSPPPLPSTPPAPPLDIDHIDVPLTPEHQQHAHMASIGKKVVPHAYIRAEFNLSRVINRVESETGIVALVVKALASALQVVPEANSILSEDGSVIPRQPMDIAVVPSTSLNRPCRIANAVALSSSEISSILNQHDENEISSTETENVSFKVIDLSHTNIEHAAAIVTPPLVGVVTVGGLQKVLTPCSSSGQKELATQVTATLSMDRRLIDEATGASLLSAMKMSLEQFVPIPSTITGSGLKSTDDILGIGLDS